MADPIEIEFVAGPTTPDKYRNKVGTKTFPFEPPGGYLPASGTEGTLLGIPGIMRDGLKWEIAEVDLRDEATKLLDEAEKLLAAPIAGEELGWVATRHARAQYLLLKAQAKILRGMRR